jgi:hypothetical protein
MIWKFGDVLMEGRKTRFTILTKTTLKTRWFLFTGCSNTDERLLRRTLDRSVH